MNSRFLSSVAVLMVCTLCPKPPASAQSNFSSFDFPGAINTQTTGITPSGNIVGRYTSPDGVLHGFLLANRKFSSIDFPGATSTDVDWINPRGRIVGNYFDQVGAQHGYLLSDGVYTTIDFPDAQGTAAFGIGATGDVVGIYCDSVGTIHGFLLSRGAYSTIDFPGATGTLPTMIAAGRITGGYFSSTGTHGFLLDAGKFRTIDCPGATFTFLSSIDPEGHMAGGYSTFDGKSHGAVITGGSCIPVDIAGASKTYANASNAQGDVAGYYTGADGIVHGYLLSKFVKTTTPVYSAAHDFSFTLNPNAAWSYGFSTSPDGPFSLYTLSGPTFFSGEVGWFGPISGCCAPGYPLVVAQPNTVPTVLDMGPGPSSYTVVRWTAPSRGRWNVVGEFSGTGLTTGDVHVVHNGTALFNSPVIGSQFAQFSLSVNVAPGDTLDFAAGPGPDGNNDSDPTGFNVTITPEL
jgi:hypothetical protein